MIRVIVGDVLFFHPVIRLSVLAKTLMLKREEQDGTCSGTPVKCGNGREEWN